MARKGEPKMSSIDSQNTYQNQSLPFHPAADQFPLMEAKSLTSLLPTSSGVG